MTAREDQAVRYWLTEKGEQAVEQLRGGLLPQPNPAHQITVTGGGPFGRAWFDCSCGITVVHASKHAANQAALRHYELVHGGRHG